MDIKKIFIVGAGTMGNGIAQTASVSGYQVTMMDVDDDALVHRHGAVCDYRQFRVHGHDVIARDDQVDGIGRRLGRRLRGCAGGQ